MSKFNKLQLKNTTTTTSTTTTTTTTTTTIALLGVTSDFRALSVTNVDEVLQPCLTLSCSPGTVSGLFLEVL